MVGSYVDNGSPITANCSITTLQINKCTYRRLAPITFEELAMVYRVYKQFQNVLPDSPKLKLLSAVSTESLTLSCDRVATTLLTSKRSGLEKPVN